jgi:phosphoglycerate dehydrogenase-like enzyme
VVDEAALVDALRNRHIAGAALDVFDGQPLPPSSPLLTLDNVLLTPHIGGATAETIERYSAMAVEDIQSVESGVRPLRLVEPAAWERYLARRPG